MDKHDAMPIRFVVVDDEPLLVEITKTLISRLPIPQGCAICDFTRSAEAIEHLRTCELEPDFLITDYNMPQYDGLDVADAAYARWPKIKSILITATAHTTEMWTEIIRRHHLSAYLAKPCKPDDFKRVIMQHTAL